MSGLRVKLGVALALDAANADEGTMMAMGPERVSLSRADAVAVAVAVAEAGDDRALGRASSSRSCFRGSLEQAAAHKAMSTAVRSRITRG